MEDRIDGYVAALCCELEQLAATFPPTPSSGMVSVQDGLTRAQLRPTVFLGGGTPTMLSLQQMERVLMAANRVVPLSDAEVTTEANPGTVIDEEYLRGLRGLGINRISFGVQSLDDFTLRVLGRIHTADEALATFAQARRAGFDRINLDFIFGLPGQTQQRWREMLKRVATLDADHLSLYSLQVEEGTPLHHQVFRGLISVPDDDETGPMYELAMEQLAAAGYHQYEISNWARHRRPDSALPLPEQASHHNVAYWLNADYLAAGAGAHAHVFPTRWHDIAPIDGYVHAMREGGSARAETLELNQGDLEAETLMMGLRLNAGIGFAHWYDRCGTDLRARYGVLMDELASLGLLEVDERGMRLSARGRLVGNGVFGRFVEAATSETIGL
ncbi:MAG: radical SAM family heme chaperone HemW [Herpetosiphon sp.]